MAYIDRTHEFLAKAKSTKGRLHDPENLLTEKERKSAEWLRDNLGGSIVAIPRADIDNVMTPDLLWNGTALEIKNTNASLSGLDQAVRKAKHQTKGGGVLIDITGADYTDDQAVKQVSGRLRRSGGKFAIIIRDANLVSYLSK